MLQCWRDLFSLSHTSCELFLQCFIHGTDDGNMAFSEVCLKNRLYWCEDMRMNSKKMYQKCINSIQIFYPLHRFLFYEFVINEIRSRIWLNTYHYESWMNVQKKKIFSIQPEFYFKILMYEMIRSERCRISITSSLTLESLQVYFRIKIIF